MVDDDGGGCLGGSVFLFKIWKIWMHAFVIVLPYTREELFYVGD